MRIGGADARAALDRSLETTEELVRVTATNIHGEAQRREKLLNDRTTYVHCCTLGDDELAKGEATLRDFDSGAQEAVALTGLTARLKGLAG